MVTFAGSNDGAFNLNAPIAGQIQDAQIKGSQLVLRSVLAYSAASRSVGGGAKAFEDATKFLVSNMLRSVYKKLEIEMMYGQMGYGVVSATGASSITISAAEFAPGIFAGGESMPIELRSSVGVLRGTANITNVDLDTRILTLDALPAGTVATDIVWHKGAYGNEFAGVHKILANTGTLFNIDASAYNQWKSNTYDAGAAQLSFAKVQKAIAKAVGKGLEGDVKVMVNPSTWADLLSDQAALRHYDSSYKSSDMQNGAQSIKFFGQNGMIEIMPSIYVKGGYAFILSMDEFSRVGSTDVTFRRPGQGDEFFRDLENSAGYELRCYSDQALFCAAPSKQVLITGIVNSA